jgi:hypothetical protein
MLVGSNGYEFAGYTYSQTEHKLATEDGCLDCHFKATSQNVVGGHSFNMRYDLEGSEVLNVGACEPCHGAIDDFNEVGPGYSVQDSVVTLIASLRSRLVTAGLVDATSGLPKSVTTSADSAGAVWNYLMASEDRSEGVHNAEYIMGLLNSAILYMDGGLAPRVTLRQAHD